MWWFLIFIITAYLTYKFAIIPILYWKHRGVPYLAPLPIFGNFYPVMTRQRCFLDFQNDIYKKFRNARCFGIHQLFTPTLVIRDVELIKQIGVKAFDHFVDHRMISANRDVLFSQNLVFLRGDKWRAMRAFLSPAFTSSKMRGMFELMSACAHRVTNHYLENTQATGENSTEIELKDFFSRYTNDVIASCAFGVECDSLKNPNNEFYRAGKDAINLSGTRGLKMLLANFAPQLFKLLDMELFPKEFSDFFINLIKETIEYRETRNIIRPDVIHLLLEARKGKLKHENSRDENDRGFAVVEESIVGKAEVRLDGISDVDIASQCFIFYLAGFDAASAALCFALTELAINPDIQEKLVAEIEEAMQNSKGKLSYEVIMKMKYLDMVVSESLRKWPPAPMLDRLCNKNFVIEPATATTKQVQVKAGEIVSIPVIGLHRDPQYFPNPERFDPERFSDENKHKINPYSYLPFGVGPRACIGSRFVLLETKILLAEFLHKFHVHVVERTSVPIILTPKSLTFAPENGFWVGLKKREVQKSI